MGYVKMSKNDQNDTRKKESMMEKIRLKERSKQTERKIMFQKEINKYLIHDEIKQDQIYKKKRMKERTLGYSKER